MIKLNNAKKNNIRESFITAQFDDKMKGKKLDFIPKRLMALFMECMVSCNTLEKKNNQLAGNSIEKEIFTHIKWEIKINSTKDESEHSNNKKKIEENEEENIEATNKELRTSTGKVSNIYEDNGKLKI